MYSVNLATLANDLPFYPRISRSGVCFARSFSKTWYLKKRFLGFSLNCWARGYRIAMKLFLISQRFDLIHWPCLTSIVSPRSAAFKGYIKNQHTKQDRHGDSSAATVKAVLLLFPDRCRFHLIVGHVVFISLWNLIRFCKKIDLTNWPCPTYFFSVGCGQLFMSIREILCPAGVFAVNLR